MTGRPYDRSLTSAGRARRRGGVVCAAALLVPLGVLGCASEPSSEEEDETDAQEASEDALVAGNQLSASRVASLLRSVGFPESVIGKMVCTAKYESRFYERAWNRNRNGSVDRGLFQINSIHLGTMRGCPRSGNALFDAETNVMCAYAVYRAQGINAWYGYRSHKSECDRTRAPSSDNQTRDNDGPVDDDNQSTNAGGCYSPTLRQGVDEAACVQGGNGIWYQCRSGAWSRGVDVRNRTGPFGACVTFHPL